MCEIIKTEELMQIYRVHTDDIRHSKNQQWLCTYYVLIFQAAIIKYYDMLSKCNRVTPSCSFWLGLVSIIIISLGTWLVMNYQTSIIQSRNKIDYYIKPSLPPEAKVALDIEEDNYYYRAKDFEFTKYFDTFLKMFIIIFIFSSFSVLYFVAFCSLFPQYLETIPLTIFLYALYIIVVWFHHDYITDEAQKKQSKHHSDVSKL